MQEIEKNPKELIATFRDEMEAGVALKAHCWTGAYAALEPANMQAWVREIANANFVAPNVGIIAAKDLYWLLYITRW